MSPSDIANADQAFATLCDLLPPSWKRMYDTCRQVGFNENQALKLVQTYILSTCPYGVRGADA